MFLVYISVFAAFANVVLALGLPIWYTLAVDRAVRHNWRYADQTKQVAIRYIVTMLSAIVLGVSLVAVALVQNDNMLVVGFIVATFVYVHYVKWMVIETSPALFKALMVLISGVRIPMVSIDIDMLIPVRQAQ